MTGLHAEDVGQEIIPLPCHLKKGTQENGEQAIHGALLNLFFFFLLFCICCQVGAICKSNHSPIVTTSDHFLSFFIQKIVV